MTDVGGAPPPRWRTLPGRMLVVAPGAAPAQHDVVYLYDEVNDAYGVLVRSGDFKGYVIEVPRGGFEEARSHGAPCTELRL